MTNTVFYPCGCVAVTDGVDVLVATLCLGDLQAYRASRGRGGQLAFLGRETPLPEPDDYEGAVEGA